MGTSLKLGHMLFLNDSRILAGIGSSTSLSFNSIMHVKLTSQEMCLKISFPFQIILFVGFTGFILLLETSQQWFWNQVLLLHDQPTLKAYCLGILQSYRSIHFALSHIWTTAHFYILVLVWTLISLIQLTNSAAKMDTL